MNFKECSSNCSPGYDAIPLKSIITSIFQVEQDSLLVLALQQLQVVSLFDLLSLPESSVKALSFLDPTTGVAVPVRWYHRHLLLAFKRFEYHLSLERNCFLPLCVDQWNMLTQADFDDFLVDLLYDARAACIQSISRRTPLPAQEFSWPIDVAPDSHGVSTLVVCLESSLVNAFGSNPFDWSWVPCAHIVDGPKVACSISSVPIYRLDKHHHAMFCLSKHAGYPESWSLVQSVPFVWGLLWIAVSVLPFRLVRKGSKSNCSTSNSVVAPRKGECLGMWQHWSLLVRKGSKRCM
jgi:hypothetical protein